MSHVLSYLIISKIPRLTGSAVGIKCVSFLFKTFARSRFCPDIYCIQRVTLEMRTESHVRLQAVSVADLRF
jgi:hypothetical protein